MPEPSSNNLRWRAQLGLSAATALLLSLALAPVNQFYLAWVGLVPWLIVVADARTKKSIFAWSWLTGLLFFGANMWWLWKVTIPGMFTLIGYLSLFFGIAGLIFRGCALLTVRARATRNVASILALAAVWTGLEWVRGNWSMFGQQGLPWLYLGVTQSPFLLMCQIADIGGVYAVSFWVALVNATVFFAWLNRRDPARRTPLIACALGVTMAVAVYGVFRMNRAGIEPGPRVLVVQANYPQSNSGEKGASPEELVRFHVEMTRRALAECEKQNRLVDLVIWSETMMPPMNDSARKVTENRAFIQATYDAIAAIAREHRVALMVGGMFIDDWNQRGAPTDRRNSAYLFRRDGRMAEQRYDKIRLVPFGEFIPFKSIPWLYRMLVAFGPAYYEEYVLTPGDVNSAPVFELERGGRTDRFIAVICFEDLVGPLVAQMIRDPAGAKRANFILNLTNDGWFAGQQMAQHLQAAVFRSIENRTSTARSVNTGISGFIDSFGRVRDTVPAGREGWSVSTLDRDPRVTFYTRHGDLFARLCALAGAALVVAALIRRFSARRVPSG